MCAMQVGPALAPLLRRKSTWFAVCAGLLTGWACWWFLPPRMRAQLAVPQYQLGVLSRDGNYLAFLGPPQCLIVEVASGKTLFANDYSDESGVLSVRFSPDCKRVTDINSGRLRCRDVPTGALSVPQPRPLHLAALVADGTGRQFALVDLDDAWLGVVDLATEKKVGILPRASGAAETRSSGSAAFPGGFICYKRDGMEVREFPSGRLRGKIPSILSSWNKTRTGSWFWLLKDQFSLNVSPWAITPDCQRAVYVIGPGPLDEGTDERIHVCEVESGTSRALQDFTGHFHALSPDGRFLIVRRFRPSGGRPSWLSRALEWLGVEQSGNRMSVYDLELNVETDTVHGNYHAAALSGDGRTVVLVSQTMISNSAAPISLSIFNFPFRRPWGKIAGFGVLAAMIVWVTGWLLGRRGKRRIEA